MNLFLRTSILVSVLASAPVYGEEYIEVQRGETLSSISQRELGDADRWQELCGLNEQVLQGDCDRISVGLHLMLPIANDGIPGVSPVSVDPAGNMSPAKQLSDQGGRTNLIDNTKDFTDPYWSPYWLKPMTEGEVSDPTGGTGATRLESADAVGSGGGTASGLYIGMQTAPGTYTVGAWIRSTQGPQAFRIGLDDSHQSSPIVVEESWEYVQAHFEVTEEISRLFQISERTRSNAPWELFGVSVEKGTFEGPPPQFRLE